MTKLIKRKTFVPDTLFFSDLHLHDRKEFSRVDSATGLNTRLMEGLSILDQTIEIIKSTPTIKQVYHLGDIFELKDRVPNHILVEFQKRLTNFHGVTFYSLLGNHDFNLPKYSALSVFDATVVNFHFINYSGWLFNIYCIPFQRRWEDFKQEWKTAHSQANKPAIICLHQDIPGGVYETGKPITGVWDLETDPDILYLSGHLHRPQKVHDIQFLGSPYQTKFSDEGQERCIWLYNSKTKQLAPQELNYSKFISLEYYGLEYPTNEELGDIVRGNYIRVVGEVLKEDYSQKEKQTIREALEKLGAKAVVFQIQIKQPTKSKIPKELIEDDRGIIRLYAKENAGGLDLPKLIKTGVDIYETL